MFISSERVSLGPVMAPFNVRRAGTKPTRLYHRFLTALRIHRFYCVFASTPQSWNSSCIHQLLTMGSLDRRTSGSSGKLVKNRIPRRERERWEFRFFLLKIRIWNLIGFCPKPYEVLNSSNGLVLWKRVDKLHWFPIKTWRDCSLHHWQYSRVNLSPILELWQEKDLQPAAKWVRLHSNLRSEGRSLKGHQLYQVLSLWKQVEHLQRRLQNNSVARKGVLSRVRLERESDLLAS